MQSFVTMLFRRLKGLGLQDEAFAALILEKTNQAIANNFPEHVASYCKAKKYKNGSIVVACHSLQNRNFMRQYADSFLELLKKEFPKEPLKSIIFVL